MTTAKKLLMAAGASITLMMITLPCHAQADNNTVNQLDQAPVDNNAVNQPNQAPVAAQVTDERIKELIEKLGDRSWREREKAQGELENYLKNNQLTAAQVLILLNARDNHQDPEVKRRLRRALEKYPPKMQAPAP